MRKSIVRELKKYLKELDEDELRLEIVKLASLFPLVNQFYVSELGDSDSVVKGYKIKIEDEYFPMRGHGKANLKNSKKILSDFKKVAIFQNDIVEINMTMLENVVEFGRTYGELTDGQYNFVGRLFSETCVIIMDEQLQNDYWKRCENTILQMESINDYLAMNMNDVYINGIEPENRDEKK